MAIKVNVDASYSSRTHVAGLGVVARNAAGSVVAWRQRRLESVLCAETAEILAAACGMELAIQFGWQEVILESDCSSVIHALNSSDCCLLAGGQFIESIKVASSFLINVSFVHVLRDGNSVAHQLAACVLEDNDGVGEFPC